MVKVSRFAINPKYPTKIVEGYDMPSHEVIAVGIAVPVSASGFMVSYPYMDYTTPFSSHYASLDHMVPNEIPNAIDRVIKDEMTYSRMLEDRIRRARDGYYQEVASAINASPVLSKMNIPISSPVPVSTEGFEFRNMFSTSSSSHMSKKLMFVIAVILLASIAFYTLRKKD